MVERWEKLKSNPARYQISNLGRLKRSASYKISEMIMTPTIHENGYYFYSLGAGRIRATVWPHIEVAYHFNKNQASQFHVIHKNGNILDNSSENLEWTQVFNGKIFKSVPDYEGYYASEDGFICAHNRIVPVMISPGESNGYLQGTFNKKEGKNGKIRQGIHRLVMVTWNGHPPDNVRICVHHIDHDKKNNHASNLKWVSYSENIQYNYDTGGQIGKAGLEGITGRDFPNVRIVMQYHPEDGLVNCFWGLGDAVRATNSNPAHISAVCHGKLKKHNGHIWRYMF